MSKKKKKKKPDARTSLSARKRSKLNYMSGSGN